MTDAERDYTRKKLAAMDRVRCDSNLSASIRAVGGELFSLCVYELGYAYPSEQYLEEKLGLGQRTIKRAVAALKAAGYFRIEKHGRNNVYRPIFDAAAAAQDKAASKMQQGPNWPLLKPEQGPKLPLSEPDRGQKGQEQGPKRTSNRGQKGPPISLEISLGASARGDAGRAGVPDGAVAPASNHPDPSGRLRERLGEAVFASWFAKVSVSSIADGTLTLAAPTAFIANYLRTQFEHELLACWRPEGIERVKIVVDASRAQAAATPPQVDARWLVEAGRHIVAKRLFVGTDKADRIIIEWLNRCGRDASGLRAILAAADARELSGDDFRRFVKQQTRALHHAGQAALQFPPMVVNRRAS